MSRHLASYVSVNGTTYGPDDDVPKDVADQITNPKAWGEDPESEDKGTAKAAASKSTKK
jgi:hypothetical protein